MINYTDVFTAIGRLAAADSSLRTSQGAFNNDISGAMNEFASQGLQSRLNEMKEVRNTTLRAMGEARQRLVAYATQRLTTVEMRAELRIPGSSGLQAVAELSRRMAIEDESIARSTYVIPAFTTIGSAEGTGRIISSAYLDGVTSPGAGMPASRNYAELTTVSQLATPQTVTARCTEDVTDGRTEGRELITIFGQSATNRWEGRTPGTGQLGTISTVTDDNIVAGAEFESFASNVPAGWQPLTGTTPGTHLTRSVASPHRGASAVRLTGDGLTSQIGIQQTIAGIAQPLRGYWLTAAARAGGDAEQGTLQVQVLGTGYTPQVWEKISSAYTEWTGTWSLYHCLIVMPAIIPTDLRIVASVSGTLTEDAWVEFDDVFLSPATYLDGLAYGAIPGQSPFRRNDLFASAISRTGTGKFQDFFRVGYGAQLPTSATPTILDSLAE